MIGDDIVYDVGGAQQCGMKAVQVRTGKYRLVNLQANPSPHLNESGFAQNVDCQKRITPVPPFKAIPIVGICQKQERTMLYFIKPRLQLIIKVNLWQNHRKPN